MVAQMLEAIGWRADTPLPTDAAPEWRIARVIAQHRNRYVLSDGQPDNIDQGFAAQPAPRYLKRQVEHAARPAVGDFVLVDNAVPPIIHSILPRRTVLSRIAAGERHVRQIIATNVDSVFVLMGLDGDFNPRRLERYLLLIQDSGAQAVIVLTKADKVEKAQMYSSVESVREIVPEGTALYAINAKDVASVAPLLVHLKKCDTGVLVGSSGAGKSTLTNTLLGRERQSTGEVREHDSRGRHTTTHRALIPLPNGGCLIDTPGMRELKLSGSEDLSASSFGDIEALAVQCRFSDCAHGNEPGCAVRAALESGVLDSARWESFKKLRDELGAASDSLEAQLERKANARVFNRALGKRLIDKYGRR